MIIAYSHLPVVEEILIERLTEYFMDELKWENLFPNFPSIRINNEFPWVPYMTDESFFEKGWLDLNKVSESLFPSLTIVTTQDGKSSTLFTDMTKEVLHKDEFDAFKTLAAETGNFIAPEALASMEEHFLTNNFLYGMHIRYQKKDTVNIDITVDDKTNIKDRLYDFVTMFLVGHGAIQLKNDLDIEINKESLNGNRSGAYNIDFGRTLRGSTIQFQVDYYISQVYYDTKAGVIASVDINHTVGADNE